MPWLEYRVITAYPKASIYLIDIPNSTLSYTTFQASELRPYNKNDQSYFYPENWPVQAQS